MYTIDTIRLKEPVGIDYAKRFARVVVSLLSLLGHLAERRKTRIDLLELSDDQLKDIGISRADAYREAARWFLDPLPFKVGDGAELRAGQKARWS